MFRKVVGSAVTVLLLSSAQAATVNVAAGPMQVSINDNGAVATLSGLFPKVVNTTATGSSTGAVHVAIMEGDSLPGIGAIAQIYNAQLTNDGTILFQASDYTYGYQGIYAVNSAGEVSQFISRGGPIAGSNFQITSELYPVGAQAVAFCATDSDTGQQSVFLARTDGSEAPRQIDTNTSCYTGLLASSASGILAYFDYQSITVLPPGSTTPTHLPGPMLDPNTGQPVYATNALSINDSGVVSFVSANGTTVYPYEAAELYVRATGTTQVQRVLAQNTPVPNHPELVFSSIPAQRIMNDGTIIFVGKFDFSPLYPESMDSFASIAHGVYRLRPPYAADSVEVLFDAMDGIDVDGRHVSLMYQNPERGPGTFIYQPEFLGNPINASGQVALSVIVPPGALPGFLGDRVSIGIGAAVIADFDMDGIPDPQDNCARVGNVDQLDYDADGIGDACELPPTVQAQISGPMGSNGWYVGSVTVDWIVNDSGAAVSQNFCFPSFVGYDTPDFRQECWVTTAAGTGVGKATVKRDATAPDIRVLSPGYMATVQRGQVLLAQYFCEDMMSGTASCVGSTANGARLDTSTAGQKTLLVTAVDNAGNTADSVIAYTVEGGSDITAPSISPVVTGTLGDGGWYRSNVNVSWNIADPESPAVAKKNCDPKIISTDTRNSTSRCTATSAGGTAISSVSIKRDTTAPSARTRRIGRANTAGWSNKPVSVVFSGSDSTSGIAACTATVVLGSQGLNQSATGSCRDNAGNVSATTSVGGINIDLSAPSVTVDAPREGAVYPRGSSVSASFACADTLSGVVSCKGTKASGQLLNTQRARGAVQFKVVARDAAGNRTTVTRTYSVQ